MLKLTNEDVTKIINNPSSPVSSQKVILTLKAWRQKHKSMMMATYRKLTDTLSECGADGQDLVEKITGLIVNAAKPITTFAGDYALMTMLATRGICMVLVCVCMHACTM